LCTGETYPSPSRDGDAYRMRTGMERGPRAEIVEGRRVAWSALADERDVRLVVSAEPHPEVMAPAPITSSSSSTTCWPLPRFSADPTEQRSARWARRVGAGVRSEPIGLENRTFGPAVLPGGACTMTVKARRPQ
jgi:hypothetical protein